MSDDWKPLTPRIDAIAEILGNIYRYRFHKAPTPSQEEREDAMTILLALDAIDALDDDE